MAYIVLLYSYTFAIFITTLVVLQDHIIFNHYKRTREVFRLILMGFIEPILYLPLIIYFGLKGYFTFYIGKELKWGTMTRTGVNE